MTPQNAVIFLGLAFVAGALALIVVSLRLRSARAAFGGILVPGRITKIDLFKDRAYVHFHYAYGSRAYQIFRFVHQTERVKSLKVGQEVEVAFDPQRPQSAWVTEFFG